MAANDLESLENEARIILSDKLALKQPDPCTVLLYRLLCCKFWNITWLGWRKLDFHIIRYLESDSDESQADQALQPIILNLKPPKNDHKNTQKTSKNLNPSKRDVVSTGRTFAQNMTFYLPIGCVRFARYCGKMYSRHLFPYSGL